LAGSLDVGVLLCTEISVTEAASRFVKLQRGGFGSQPHSSLVAFLARRFPRFEGESKVTFFDGNFSTYEDWRQQTFGDAATRPHRITYRKLTR